MGSRKFLAIVYYHIFFIIFTAGISFAMKGIIQSGKIKDIYFKSFPLTNASGDIWTLSEDDYVESCSEGDSVFITKTINIPNTLADIIYISLETNLIFTRDNVSFNKILGIYFYNGTAKKPVQSDANSFANFFQNFSLIFTVQNSTASARNGTRWTHTFKVYRNEMNSMILAVRGTSVCARVFAMKVYYYYCEEKNFKGVTFQKTASPYEGWKKVKANCLVNNRRTLNGFCRYNGTWNLTGDPKCFCKKGYELNSFKECTRCPANHFKSTSSNESCQPCPKNNNNTSDGSSCECIDGYYHGDSSSSENSIPAPCFGPIEEKLIIKVKRISEKTVEMKWNVPHVDEKINKTLHYEVECFVCEDKICDKSCEKAGFQPKKDDLYKTSVKISNLHENKRYKFRVYPKTVINKHVDKAEWNYTETFYLLESNSTIAPSTRKSYFDYAVVSGIAIGFLFMVMVVLLIVVVKRKTEYRRHLIIRNHHQVELPECGQKLYVDPTIYDSPEDALTEFASELDPSVLVLEKLIGGGEFGDVYKGIMKCSEGRAVTVAVKTLKEDHTEKNETDFLLEASVMGQFHDPNVIHLVGVITKSFPRMIIAEYMSNGSLDRFLRLNDDKLSDLQLIEMARGVASGMAYLSAMNFIHRDLAARNILVDDDLLCKIADFGLSRSLGSDGADGEYNISGGKIPIRWTAPEVISFRKFSTSSDVWSFGILLWEIMSFGERPYWDWDNHKVMNEVEEGFRLPPPKDCPKAVHNLMLSCWKANRNERPKFEYITQVMDGWIRSPETINEDNRYSVIGSWLESIKMGDYVSIFTKAGYDSPQQLVGIGDDDLLKIGVRLIGHRNKILKSVKALNGSNTPQKIPIKRADSIVV